MAEVFARRDVAALVVRGDDGLDELTTVTTSTVRRVRDGQVTELVVDPTRLGIPPATASALRGGDAAFNASVVRELLAGRPGPVRDAVLLNAAAALVSLDDAATPAGDPSTPIEDALAAGLATAAESVDSGAAAAVLDRWVEVSSRFPTAS
jgi:anthranilate phosphoribosyltransferase